MADTLFKNLTFHADVNTSGIRLPLPTTAPPDPEIKPEVPTGPPPEKPEPEVPPDPEIPPEQPEDPEEPDPGVPGDVGPITGEISNTSGDAPVITRAGSSAVRDIFINQGQTLTLTYKASKPCFMQRAHGFSGMQEIYNAAGDEITISWPVPMTMASQSLYIGVNAETYGGRIEFAERLHIGKTLADLEFCGLGEAKPTIGYAVDTIGAAGKTLIIRNGIYTGDANIISIGRHNDTPYGMGCPNGAHTVETVTITENQLGVPVTRQENIIRVQKYTNIMAETPLGVVLDRNHKRIGIKIDGNEAPSPNLGNNEVSGAAQYAGGGRTSRGIIVDGVAVRNCREFATYIAGARKCFIRTFSCVDGTIWGPQSDNQPVVSGTFVGSGEDCGFFRGTVLAHARLMNNNGRSHKNVWRQIIATQGATQQREDNQAITFISYWGCRVRWDNCIVIDDFHYWKGIVPGAGEAKAFTNGAFLSNRGFTDIFQGRGCMVYNSVRMYWMSDRSGQRLYKEDDCQDSVFWKHMGGNSGGGSGTYNGPPLNRGPCKFKNVTVGRSTSTDFNASLINGWGTTDGLKNSFDGVLMISPSWDYASRPTDIVMTTPSHTMLKVGVVNAPPVMTPEFQQLSAQFYNITAENAQSSGAKYITRAEPGSLCAEQGLGCQDYFMKTHGQFGAGWNDVDFDTVYAENWVNRLPLIRLMQERRFYYCVSNGITFNGDVGCSKVDQHLVDYVNSEGTTPLKPRVTPYVVDIYGYQIDDTVYLRWRMPAKAYRATMVAVDVYVDSLRVGTNLPLAAMGIELKNINKGLRTFYVIIKDSVTGDSGPSTRVTLQVKAINEFASEGTFNNFATLGISGTTYGVTDTELTNGLSFTNLNFAAMTKVKPKVSCKVSRPNTGSGAAIRLTTCTNINISGFEIAGGLWGVQMYDCSHIWISGNYIHDVGQEFVQFYMLSTGAHTDWQVVDNNMIRSGLSNAQYGEGVYLGIGSTTQNMWGPVDNVLVKGNYIGNTTAEAVDIKPQVVSAIVEDNIFENIDLQFNGAVTIGTEAELAREGNFIVRRNTSRNVTNRSGFEPHHVAIGRGNVDIYDNFFDGAGAAKENGIALYATSSNDVTKTVRAYNNRFGNILAWRRIRLNVGDAGTGVNRPMVFAETSTSKPLLLLDAGQTNSLSLSGSNVTGWADQGELKYNAAQSVSGKYPTTGARQIGGKNALNFNGSNQYMKITLGPTYVYSSMSFAVVDIDTKDSIERIFEVAEGTLSRISLGVGPSGVYYSHNQNFTPVYLEAGTGKMIIAAYKSGSKVYIQAKGLNASNNTAGATTMNGTLWTIGCYGDGSSGFFDGAIAEIRTYDYFNQAHFDAIVTELGNKWGLAYTGDATGSVTPPPAYTPLAHWDMSDTTSITQSGGFVDSMEDLSGNGYTVAQTAPSRRPSYVAGTYPSIFCDTTQWLAGSTGNNIGGKSYIVFMVVNTTARSGTAYWFGTAGATVKQSLLCGTNSTNLLRFGSGETTFNTDYTHITNTTVNTRMLFRIVHTPTSMTLHLNGTQIGSINPGVLTGNQNYMVGMGYQSTAGRSAYKTHIHEILVIDNSDAGAVGYIESQLKTKWGIP